MGLEKYQGKTALIACVGGFLGAADPTQFDYVIGVNEAHADYPINLWVTDGKAKRIWRPEYENIDVWVVGQFDGYLSESPTINHRLDKTPDYVMTGAMMRSLSEGMRGFPSPYYAAIVIAKELGMRVTYFGDTKGEDQSVFDYYAHRKILVQWQNDNLIVSST